MAEKSNNNASDKAENAANKVANKLDPMHNKVEGAMKGLPQLSGDTKKSLVSAIPFVTGGLALFGAYHMSQIYDYTKVADALEGLNELARAYGVSSGVDSNSTLVWAALLVGVAGVLALGYATVQLFSKKALGVKLAVPGLFLIVISHLIMMLGADGFPSSRLILWAVLAFGGVYAVMQVKSEMKG